MALLRVVRASTIEASSLSRPRGIVETDGDVCDRALDTVDHFGHRVITGEVASHASLQIDKRIKRSRLSRPIAGLLEIKHWWTSLPPDMTLLNTDCVLTDATSNSSLALSPGIVCGSGRCHFCSRGPH